MKSRIKKFISAAAVALFFAPLAATAQISEPDTVFYGQIINRTSGQTLLLTSGNIVWTIVRPDGRPLTLTGNLAPLKNGQYSYRIAVPHQALVYGLTVADDTVALPGTPANCAHLLITVDGHPASILAPGTGVFSVGEALRAATYRLDLELFNELPDTSGDGIPDWWKSRYGITNPDGDNDGDGWSNLQEFRNGGNPNQDNRRPTLATTEYWAYADGLTAALFDAVDADTPPAQLRYTLAASPESGTFYLNNVSPDGSVNAVPLGLNGTFTQEDVNRGKIIFVHNGTNTPALPASFILNLCDENPTTPSGSTFTGPTILRSSVRPPPPPPPRRLASATFPASPSANSRCSSTTI
jgi:hypothetical protein